jgi:hypothetical protein
MSTIVHISSTALEKDLAQEHIYQYHPDKEIKDKILEDLTKHSKSDFTGNEYTINIRIEISVKEYVKKKVEKKFYYENQ